MDELGKGCRLLVPQCRFRRAVLLPESVLASLAFDVCELLTAETPSNSEESFKCMRREKHFTDMTRDEYAMFR